MMVNDQSIVMGISLRDKVKVPTYLLMTARRLVHSERLELPHHDSVLLLLLPPHCPVTARPAVSPRMHLKPPLVLSEGIALIERLDTSSFPFFLHA